MSITKGTWVVNGDYVIARQNEEDYVDICRNLASSDDACLISAAPDLLEACEIGLVKALAISTVATELGAEITPTHKKHIEQIEAAISKAKQRS